MAREGARLDEADVAVSQGLYEELIQSPIPPEELLRNLGLFMNRQVWADYLYMHELYKKIINVHGCIAEFGVLWGKNLSFFTCLRGIYEPYNLSRKIIGFDTFAGFVDVEPGKDGSDVGIRKGYFDTTEGYETRLARILELQEQKCAIPHIKKNELVKGDISTTLEVYIAEHPETVFAMVYIDVDVYTPTKKILELVTPRLVRGSIIGFDELCHPRFPGETAAFLEETRGDVRLERLPFGGYKSYCVVEA